MRSEPMESLYPKSTTRALLTIGIICVAFNLRPGITSVGPLTNVIQSRFHLSNGLIGLMTTIPLVAFAMISPVAPKIGRRFGNERTVFLGLLLLSGGILLRSARGSGALFVGTALIGTGIAICNVLIPGVVKMRFPDKVGLMTSTYSTSMVIFAGIASGVSIPISQGLHYGWRNTLLSWAILSVAAALVWMPQLTSGTQAAPGNRRPTEDSIWRSPLAWQVTLFMGLQSFLFYSTVAWFPDILTHHGISASTAGWMLSLIQIVSIPATFATPLLANRATHQSGLVVELGALYIIGLAGLTLGGNMVLMTLWTVMMGLGQGASISLALAFLGLRTTNAARATELSGMAQSIGYLLAAIGPVLLGMLYDHLHSWTGPLLIMLMVLIAMIIVGLGAGRNRYVDKTQNPTGFHTM